MNERFRQIEHLYHAALEQDESEWEVFLDAARGPDEGLRQEVDSLLFYSKHSENFLESSALETVAQKLANEERCELTLGIRGDFQNLRRFFDTERSKKP